MLYDFPVLKFIDIILINKVCQKKTRRKFSSEKVLMEKFLIS